VQVYNKLSLTFQRRARIDLAFGLAVFALLVWQLFVPPALSVANDHDFEKILGHLCLGPAQTNGPAFFDYAVLHFQYDPDACIDWPMRTTNELAFHAAMALNRRFYSKTDFDLRFMGIIYGLIFFAGFATLQRALRQLPLALSAVAQTTWIFIVCNAVYVPMFNTLYFDALSLATMTGALASAGIVAFRRNLTPGSLLRASLWLALLAGSKGQHAPLALLCIPVLWIRWIAAQPRILAARTIGTAMILAGAWLSMSTMPAFYRGEATFNALFYRILPAVKNPVAYLAETRIPVSWIQYSGEVAFAVDVPLRDPYYEEQFGKWFGPVDLLRLYLRHPSAAWLIARGNLDEASMDRVRIRMSGTPHRLGNYEESTGKPPQAISHFFTLWAAIKDAVFGERPLAYLAYILGAIALAWILAPPVRPMRLLLAIVTAGLAVEFAICMLDGADGGRHLTLFNFLLDLLVCADIVFVAERLSARFTLPVNADTARWPSSDRDSSPRSSS
jgi:hypothetical protein